MPVILTCPPLLAFLGDVGWIGSLAIVVGAGGIGLLAWQLGRARREYALDLAEQARQVAEEQERAALAEKAREAVTRESQAKSEMLATLSREIRAHLNGVIGSADLLLDHTLKPHQREHLTTLRSSAEALHQSLNDVLDYASIETGKIQIGRASFDLRQPLIEVVESLLPPALLKGLELVLIVAPDVPVLVSGDAPRLRQIVFNLMANAVKFSPGGRVVLRVELPGGSVAPSQQGATWLRFSVSDTGEGVPDEMQATLFERSVEADPPSPRKFGGSGLELAISKRLVELMGGQIGTRRLPESGSEFWVMLPLVADQTQTTPTLPASDGLHVVVLDEQTASRVAASAMLARLGVDQDAADTVAGAVMLLRDALEDEACDPVLLLDETVAKTGGAELARLFAADAKLRSTRVVLLARDPDVAIGHGVGVVVVVRKPLLRADVLAEALKAEQVTEGVRTTGSRPPFEAVRGAPPAPRPGPRVLVVDDDAISRSVTSQLLERLGCVVDVALNGPEAIAQAGATAFELIFMDCQMPGMDGFTTTERIRAAAGNKVPPIVAVTANTAERDRDHCFAVGMCDFVGKPVTKVELARILKRWAPSMGAGLRTQNQTTG